MSEAVLLVGTKKGLWIGRSDERREQWEFGKPEFLMQGIYATCIDTRGRSARGCSSAGTVNTGDRGSTGLTILVRTWTETQGAAVRFPDDLGSSVERVWQIQPGPGRARRGLGRDAAVRAVPLRRPGRVVRAWSARCGTIRTGRAVGRRLRRPGHPHDRAATRPIRSGSRWPCPPAASTAPRTAASPGAPHNTRHQGLLLPRPVAGVRPVRAQGGRAIPAAGADVRPEPPRRLPLRRRRRSPGPRSPTGCRPTSDSRSWSTRTSRRPSSCSR